MFPLLHLDRPLISILQVGKADGTGQDVRWGRIIGQGEERRRERQVEWRRAQRNINGSLYPVSVLPGGWDMGPLPWQNSLCHFVFLVIHDSSGDGFLINQLCLVLVWLLTLYLSIYLWKKYNKLCCSLNVEFMLISISQYPHLSPNSSWDTQQLLNMLILDPLSECSMSRCDSWFVFDCQFFPTKKNLQLPFHNKIS